MYQTFIPASGSSVVRASCSHPRGPGFESPAGSFKVQVPVTGNCKQMLLCCIEPVCKREKGEEAMYHHLLLHHWKPLSYEFGTPVLVVKFSTTNAVPLGGGDVPRVLD